MNGGNPLSSGLPELMERIPTMMIGTNLVSELLPPSCAWVLELPRSIGCLAVELSDSLFWELEFSTVPSLNILKKFNWLGRPPGLPGRPSSPATLCLKAEWRLPFCKDSRKLSKAPFSSPLSDHGLAGSSPIMDAAVCTAAAESRRDSIAVWSSPRCMDELRRLNAGCGRLWRSRDPRSRNDARRAEAWASGGTSSGWSGATSS